MKTSDVAKHIFARNSKLEEVHVTADGTGFHTHNQAKNHAVRLKNQKVDSFSREDVLPAKPEKTSKDDSADLDKVKAAAERVEYAQSLNIDTEKIEDEAQLEEAIANAEAEKAKSLEVVNDDEVDTSFLKGNVGECEEEIEKVTSLEVLDAIEKAELAAEEPRKGVKKAIAKQREALKEKSNE